MDQVAGSATSQLTFDLGPRRPWAGLTAGIALLGLAGVLALAALVHCLLPESLACLAVTLLVLPTLGLVITVGSALTGRVCVDADQLRVCFGLLGGVRVARADIARAERFVPPLIRPVGLGLDLPPGSRQVTVSRGGVTRYVRVTLHRPVLVRTAVHRHVLADELVIGTAVPDRLLAALT